MATLESDKVERALRGKMKADREDSGDWYYFIKDDELEFLGNHQQVTCSNFLHGPKSEPAS